MPALDLDWNKDLKLSPNGGLMLAYGWTEIRQRIIRRVMTSARAVLPDGSIMAADYIYHPEYGLGLRALVNRPIGDEFIKKLEQRVKQAVQQDTSVDPNLIPVVQIARPRPEWLEINVGLRLQNGDRQGFRLWFEGVPPA